MASTKISALPGASTLTGAETIPVVQGGVTKKVTTDQFLTKDASGNVGLGATPSAFFRLDINGNTRISSAGAEGFEVQPGAITYVTAYNRSTAAYTPMAVIGEYISFGTGTWGAERARIDASGNLGLGVTPSASWFGGSVLQQSLGSVYNNSSLGAYDVSYNSIRTASDSYEYQASGLAATRFHQRDGAYKWYTAPSGTAGNAISFTQAMTLDANGTFLLESPTAAMYVRPSATANNALARFVNAGGTGFVGLDSSGGGISTPYALNVWHSGNYPIVLGTSGTERARIDASGNLLVGTTSTGINDANCFTHNVPAGWFGISHVLGTASGTEYINFGLGGVVKGSITQNGTTGVNYNTSSDARLKENISNADNGSALIDSLQVRQFDWKSDGSHQRYGFVAQELDAVYPEAVSKPADPDEMMGVDYSKLVPLLVQEIKSLRARVAALETV